MSVTILAYTRYSVRIYLQLLMSCLRHLYSWCPAHIVLVFFGVFFSLSYVAVFSGLSIVDLK